MDEAEHCDRVAVIDHGRIVALDAPGVLKNALGGDLITITSRDTALAATELRQRYGIAPTVTDATVSFRVRGGESLLARFVRTFAQPVEAIALRRPTLDDVFLELTGHEIRDGRGETPGDATVTATRSGR